MPGFARPSLLCEFADGRSKRSAARLGNIPHRVYRGGSFQNLARQSRSAYRDACSSWTCLNRPGLRVCLVSAGQSGRPNLAASRRRPLQREESQGAPGSLGQAPRRARRDHQLDWHEAVVIPPGEFDMGSTAEEVQWGVGPSAKEPGEVGTRHGAGRRAVHRVKITKSFCLAAYPVD